MATAEIEEGPSEAWLFWEQHLGDLASALEDLDEAIRLDPEEASYYHRRAMARLYEEPEGSPLEDALPDLEEAIRLDPDTSWYRAERGYIRFCQTRWADAAEDFEKQDFRSRNESFPYLGATWSSGSTSPGSSRIDRGRAWERFRSISIGTCTSRPATGGTIRRGRSWSGGRFRSRLVARGRRAASPRDEAVGAGPAGPCGAPDRVG